MTGPHLTPATVRATTTRRCRRFICGQVNDHADDPYCSDDCRRIDEAVAKLPPARAGAVADMGRGAAVIHAFDWLDARKRDAS